ncbi:CAIB/BAIF family protein [Microbacterium esteraromaticum]|uniref:CAIB/BAIF family protein n=1 Tax=Microbacterium esteraromaticum TaxID=57043 RepID=A0A1R4KTP9_9MICO|nr:CoA transferase [Microbacterium esteraromaticum]SJN47559.1 CAIB/BAIF family protein [Microbacterium esteraromaticum]
MDSSRIAARSRRSSGDDSSIQGALLSQIGADLGIPRSLIAQIPPVRSRVPLRSRLATGALAWASVTAAALAARPDRPALATPDSNRIALAYRSDRLLRIDAEAQEAFSPYSKFWPASDGWLRTHANYSHHARALNRAFGSANASADELGGILAGATVQDSVAQITSAGGLAVAVQPEDPHRDAALRALPLVDVRRIADSAPPSRTPTRRALPFQADAPLAGIRVLDLTRVIAGPVCTRTLALLGAEVLRIDPPDLPEISWQHLDTGHGKRSARLDARSTQMAELLARADVVVLGYRPAALDRLGLSPERLAAQHPQLVIAQLSAWGADDPDRRGFDSLVQAESGIALVESADGETPGALPAQALDHSAGYLLAAAICAALARQRSEGGAWLVSTSLRRVAAELLGMPRRTAAEPVPDIDPAEHLQHFTLDGHSVTTVRSALPGFSFEAPRPWGADAPAWR